MQKFLFMNLLILIFSFVKLVQINH